MRPRSAWAMAAMIGAALPLATVPLQAAEPLHAPAKVESI